jgi:hypothetical protein
VTGRGAGFCTSYSVPGYTNYGPRWLCGSGGRGRRNRYYATGLTGWQRAGTGWIDAGAPFVVSMNPELELATLKTQAENLARTLDSIRKQIETLEAQDRKDAQ